MFILKHIARRFYNIYYIECQRRFLDNKITPVVSKLIKKVASYQPSEVIEFICEELFSMFSGKNVDLGKNFSPSIMFN